MKHAFLDIYSDRESFLHGIDPRAKIPALLSVIICAVSTPPEAVPLFLAYMAILVIMLILSDLPPGFVLKRSLVILPFIGLSIVFLPFMPAEHSGSISIGWTGLRIYYSGLVLVWNIFIKALIGVACVILLTSTTPFTKLLEGFRRLGMPGIFIMVASFMYRYLFVIADEAMMMKMAGDSRGFGARWLWHAKTIGNMAGSLFIRSYGRAERIYAAMASRGFEGDFAHHVHLSIKPADVAFTAVTVASAVLIRIFL